MYENANTRLGTWLGLGIGTAIGLTSTSVATAAVVPFRYYRQKMQPGWQHLRDFLDPLTSAGIHRLGLDFVVNGHMIRGLLDSGSQSVSIGLS
jgi:hypothetical protein